MLVEITFADNHTPQTTWINPQQVTAVRARLGTASSAQVCLSDGQAFFAEGTVDEVVRKFNAP